MDRGQYVTWAFVGAALVALAWAPLGAETLTDNFDATGEPLGENDYNLNAELDVRQAGTLAPANYTRIAGNANYTQVNNSTPDAHGDDSGLGKLDIFAIAFSAVQLDVVPVGHSVDLSVEVTPVANNPALDTNDWACICVGATGGNGFVNNGAAGVGVLIRDNGGVQVFNNGPNILDIPVGTIPAASTYLVEISLNAKGTEYSLSVNGTLLADAISVSTSGRLVQMGGYNGAAPAGQPFQMHLFDNLSIVTEPAPITSCFTGVQAPAPLTADFDASCTIVLGTPQSYEWDFGDTTTATGETVSHVYASPGAYDVTLTVTDTAANVDTITQTIPVYERVLDFSDNFERPDGPIDGWTTAVGDWSLSGGELVSGTTNAEVFIWAGEFPVIAPANAVFEFDHSFLAAGSNATVGRHGGFQFHSARPTVRGGATPLGGYLVDWIDRASDFGIRLSRHDFGVNVDLANSGLGNLVNDPPADPPLHYRVEVDGDHIRVYGDDVLYIDVVDTTYRSGFFGFWAYSSEQSVAIDNVTMTGEALTPCFTVVQPFPRAEDTVSFDASCSYVLDELADIVAYGWDFGDGTTASGMTVDHVYDVADVYTVTLTVEDDTGAVMNLGRAITIGESAPFADCFDRAAGPVDGWLPLLGDWTINASENLEAASGATESYAYAGDPLLYLPAEFTAEVDWSYVAGTSAVGRHGAVHFFWNKPTTDRFAADSRGYVVYFIDRASDRGLNLLRFDDTTYEVLQAGTPGLTEPPTTLRIEVAGPTIRVLADGVVAIEVDDDTYRDGLFGIWTYSSNNVLFDNVRVWTDAPPEPCAPSAIQLAGDCNGSGARDITDVICYVKRLFPGFLILGRGTPPAPLPCASESLSDPGNLAVLDIDRNQQVGVSDLVLMANYLFTGGPPPLQGEECFALSSLLDCSDNVGCP